MREKKSMNLAKQKMLYNFLLFICVSQMVHWLEFFNSFAWTCVSELNEGKKRFWSFHHILTSRLWHQCSSLGDEWHLCQWSLVDSGFDQSYELNSTSFQHPNRLIDGICLASLDVQTLFATFIGDMPLKMRLEAGQTLVPDFQIFRSASFLGV